MLNSDMLELAVYSFIEPADQYEGRPTTWDSLSDAVKFPNTTVLLQLLKAAAEERLAGFVHDFQRVERGMVEDRHELDMQLALAVRREAVEGLDEDAVHAGLPVDVKIPQERNAIAEHVEEATPRTTAGGIAGSVEFLDEMQ